MAGELRQRQPKGSSKKASAGTPKGKTAQPAKKKTYSGRLFARALAYLFEEDDASYLAVFRILWGVIMAYEAYTYTLHDFAKMNASFYNSIIQFKYYGFDWCHVPQDPFYLKLCIVAMLVFGITLTLGFLYRFSCVMFFCLFTYMYVLEQAMYLNHFYLVCVLSFMMIVLPCNCYFSVDAWIWPSRYYSRTCPKWCLIFVKTELAIVYTYAGICKVNEDWLRAEPLRDWLANRDNTPLIGPLLVRESAAYFMSYGGMIYDLVIAPLLLWRRTLPLGLAATMFFHISNKIVFNIGIFPWMMIASTTFFFRPDWPRRLLYKLTRTEFVPIETRTFSQTAPRPLTAKEWLVVAFFVVFVLHQVLIPIRLHLYPGIVAWNEYGHQFSWRMKLRTKKCDAIALAYSEDTHMAIDVPLNRMLNRRQSRKFASRPDMIAQMAEFTGKFMDDYLAGAFPNATLHHEIYIESWCELNNRPYQPLTNGTYNLRDVPRWENPRPWVLEVEPLTDEEKKNYPWNFDWNFNWLKGIDRLPSRYRKDFVAREREMNENAKEKWRKMLEARDPRVVFTDLPPYQKRQKRSP